MLIAGRGTMVSTAELTAAPVEALLLPDAASALVVKLRAASLATLEALAAALAPSVTVPATGLVACVPLTAPPEVLT